MFASRPPGATLIDSVRRLQAIVATLTTRAFELAAQPGQHAEAALIDSVCQRLGTVIDRIGRPAVAWSIQLVASDAADPARLYGSITLHKATGLHPAVLLFLHDSGLTISAGRQDDGRPYVQVDTEETDQAHHAPDGSSYLDVGLNDVDLSTHRPGAGAPSDHAPAAQQPEQPGSPLAQGGVPALPSARATTANLDARVRAAYKQAMLANALGQDTVAAIHERIETRLYVTCPNNRTFQVDEFGYIQGEVAVDLNVFLANDLDSVADLVSEALTGSSGLLQVSWQVVGHDPGGLRLLVTGNPSGLVTGDPAMTRSRKAPDGPFDGWLARRPEIAVALERADAEIRVWEAWGGCQATRTGGTSARPHTPLAWNPFLAELTRQLRRGEPLSDQQAEFYVRRVAEVTTQGELEQEREQEREGRRAPAPEGTVTFTGTVVTIRSQPGYLGRPELKMLVVGQAAGGGEFRVWCAVPRRGGPCGEGDRIRLTVELQRSERDPSFAFGKHPRRVKPQETR